MKARWNRYVVGNARGSHDFTRQFLSDGCLQEKWYPACVDSCMYFELQWPALMTSIALFLLHSDNGIPFPGNVALLTWCVSYCDSSVLWHDAARSGQQAYRCSSVTACLKFWIRAFSSAAFLWTVFYSSDIESRCSCVFLYGILVSRSSLCVLLCALS